MFRALLFFFIAASAQNTLVVDEECLNYTIYPVQYEITIMPYINKDRSFYDCQISITVIANAPDIRVIELEAKNMSINEETIKVFKGDRDIVNRPRPYIYDKERGKLFIYLSEALMPYKGRHKQNYVITMSFRKEVTYDSVGIFLVKYVDEYGSTKYLLQTRLSPDNAKYFIPCFDNPQFESVFKFIVYEMPQNAVGQHTNTSLVISKELRKQRLPDRRLEVHYVPSSQIALYQVGFHHSDFSDLQTSSKYNNDTIVIWAPPEDIKNCYFILNYAETILDFIHEYSTVNRSIVTEPINIVGIPKQLGGYEIASWNLLTNSIIRVIYKPDFISIKQTERMKFELAQQLSRIWLGNPGEEIRTRWREEWFKEGVATYLAYYFLAQFNSGSQHMKRHLSLDRYGLHMKHTVMGHDWHHSTPPLINFDKQLVVSVPTRYKALVTMKTASLLWMVENWLGSEKFHQALVKYINMRRGMYISLEDFMANLDYDTVECFHQFFNGSTASKILNSWFRHSGYPVIEVQVMRGGWSNNVIQLKQRKFSFTRDFRQESDYLIPISYFVQNYSNCYNCYRPRFTIGKQTYTFKENLNDGWIILNRNSSGYYRVNYDELTWNLIAQTLRDNMHLIDELNRAQIVNDVFALYAAGDIRRSLAMNVLEYLDQEKSFVVWTAVIDGYEMLRVDGADCHMTKTLYKEWQNFLRKKVVFIYKILLNSIERSEITRLFKSKITEFACSVKYQKCLDQMSQLYKQWRSTNIRIDPDLRLACYHTAFEFGQGPSKTDRLNAFELEDQTYAEYSYRRESNFLVKIPIGELRPENMSLTTAQPEDWSTEKSALKDPSKDNSETININFLVLICSALVKILLQ